MARYEAEGKRQENGGHRMRKRGIEWMDGWMEGEGFEGGGAAPY